MYSIERVFYVVFIEDYFSFIKRLMELLRKFSRIKKLELEIQTISDAEQQQPVYENSVQRYTEEIRDKILDLLEQSFPNPMFVNDLAK